MNKIQKEILQTAEQFIGLTELPNNSGFYDHAGVKSLTHMHPQEAFEAIGWQKGFAWCMLAAELIWKLAYSKFDYSVVLELDKLFSASVAQTEANFKRSDLFEVNTTPKKGSIAIWRHFDSKRQIQWSGHAGIVKSFNKITISTFDGNTNSTGGREGIEFAERKRLLDFTEKPGLVLKCFIHPKKI